jgi:hypothetical protein
MTDVKYLYSLLSLKHAVDHAIDMRLLPIEKVAESLILRRNRASVGMVFQSQDGLL